MLVVSRKKNEAVMIGGQIEVIVKEIGADKVQLAIKAPQDFVILRRELYEAAQLNLQASQPLPSGEIEDFAKALQNRNNS
jgi:carbon storage regulator